MRIALCLGSPVHTIVAALVCCVVLSPSPHASTHMRLFQFAHPLAHLATLFKEIKHKALCITVYVCMCVCACVRVCVCVCVVKDARQCCLRWSSASRTIRLIVGFTSPAGRGAVASHTRRAIALNSACKHKHACVYVCVYVYVCVCVCVCVCVHMYGQLSFARKHTLAHAHTLSSSGTHGCEGAIGKCRLEVVLDKLAARSSCCFQMDAWSSQPKHSRKDAVLV